jgi:NAD(P)H-flavin reductase
MAFGGGQTAFAVSVRFRRALSEKVLLVRLERAAPDFVWLPGQHIEVAAQTAPNVSHYYSIASARDPRRPGEFELVLSTSASPELLSDLEPGRTLLVSPAAGEFVWEKAASASLLVGMGTGIAPLRAMVQAALVDADPAHDPPEQRRRVVLLLGARTEADLLFRDEFRELATRDPRFVFEPTLSRADEDWRGARGRVHDHLERATKGLGPFRAYVCGSTRMVADSVAKLAELGFSGGLVRSSSYGD